LLIIEARKESFTNPKYDPKASANDWRESRQVAEYTSASLVTKGKASWRYGRFEIRAKLPTGQGTWPAIWTLGTNMDKIGWPSCGEIDIMENVGFNPDIIHFTVHTKKYNHLINTHKSEKTEIAKPYDTFHVYALEWYPDRLDFFVDDKKYFTYTNDGTGPDTWPFDEPQYLILNVAIGGDWGGQRGVDNGIFPQRMSIDYVRVYRQIRQ
jgi:beta-glucanase (GH16 family)